MLYPPESPALLLAEPDFSYPTLSPDTCGKHGTFPNIVKIDSGSLTFNFIHKGVAEPEVYDADIMLETGFGFRHLYSQEFIRAIL